MKQTFIFCSVVLREKFVEINSTAVRIVLICVDVRDVDKYTDFELRLYPLGEWPRLVREISCHRRVTVVA